MSWANFPLPRGPLGNGPGNVAGWRISSYFGGRIDPITGRPGSHGGMDLAWKGCSGRPIYAPFAGRLLQGWDASGGGWWSGVTAPDGSYVGLGHASAFAVGAHDRQVSAGDVIAYVGMTGSATGPHLHVAWKPAGLSRYADPYDVLTDSANRVVGEAQPVPTPIPASGVNPSTTGDEGMADQFSFPDGTTYALALTAESDTGFAWVHIGSEQSAWDGQDQRLLASGSKPLAQGNDTADALFERHPVLSGPHYRTTHT